MSLKGYSPQSCKESGMIEATEHESKYVKERKETEKNRDMGEKQGKEPKDKH